MSYVKGLEGVVVGETAISHVEGDIGRLSYRGYGIEALADKSYIEVVWLVLFGELPVESDKVSLEAFLNQAAVLSEWELAQVEMLQSNGAFHPMTMLQAMIPLIGKSEQCFGDLSEEANHGLRIIGKLPSLVAKMHRTELGESYVSAETLGVTSRDPLQRFLSEFNGAAADAEHVNILRVVQILQLDHSFNAGTFSTRVVSSTLAPIEAVLAAGVGTLSGILHGGADEAALRDAKKVPSPSEAMPYLEALLASGEKLMGMGHREYKTVDPRSLILKPLAEALCMGHKSEQDYLTLCALETEFNIMMQAKGKDIWANLEFYKGVVYEAIGIPMHYFTSVFALARTVGWLAHFIESRADNRLIRPKAEYVGSLAREIS